MPVQRLLGLRSRLCPYIPCTDIAINSSFNPIAPLQNLYDVFINCTFVFDFTVTHVTKSKGTSWS